MALSDKSIGQLLVAAAIVGFLLAIALLIYVGIRQPNDGERWMLLTTDVASRISRPQGRGDTGIVPRELCSGAAGTERVWLD